VDGLSLGRAITVLAEADPDRPAVTGWEPDGSRRSVTRAELDLRTNRIARAWADLGVGEGDFVSIALPNSVAFCEAAIAAWKLGAVPQPLSARLPDRELRAIVELADSRLVLGAAPGAHPGRHVLPVGWEADPTISDAALPDRISPSMRAMTSGGSTGRPKLIVNSSPGTVEMPLIQACQIAPDECHIVPGPMYHNGPFALSMYGLCVGNHVVLFPRFDAEATLAAVEEHRGTFMFVVPTMMLRMWRLGEEARARYDLSSLEVLWHFAAPCPEWLKADWIDWLGGERIWELYGGTELQAMTVIRGDEWLEHRGSVGRCVIGEMKVVDPDTGADLPAGEVGEIYMRRDADGTPSYHYLGSDARTLPGHWESLGDIGMMDADGYVYLSDRRSDMILVGGENVYPAEVEGALMEHPDVLSAAVIGLPDDELGSRVHAIVQVTASVDDEELSAFLTERLVRYKLPRSFEYTSEPVRDDAGKVRRSALRADRL
jgi:bile acid-coenzyme A ligase